MELIVVVVIALSALWKTLNHVFITWAWRSRSLWRTIHCSTSDCGYGFLTMVCVLHERRCNHLYLYSVRHVSWNQLRLRLFVFDSKSKQTIHAKVDTGRLQIPLLECYMAHTLFALATTVDLLVDSTATSLFLLDRSKIFKWSLICEIIE